MSEEKKQRFRRAAADQPVRSIDDDLLGTGPFALALADAIAGWREPESLVVALTGPWGTGKSSIKNFVIEALRAMPEKDRPDVLPFTPWDVAGSGTVADRLLREIAIALNQRDASADDRARAEKWEEWAAALNLATAVPAAIPQNSGPQLMLAGLAAFLLPSLVTRPSVALAIEILGGVLLALGATLAASATLAERTAKLFTARAKRRERTLDALKEELRSVMAKRERQLVVFVDEIDRLPANEVQLLLRAIRANADFPQMVFVLAFERSVVENAIKDQAHVDGGDYLKKIVQIPFSLPMTNARRIQKVLFQQLDEMLSDLPGTVPFDERRWGNLFFGGISYYFRTLRDVYRFTTTVEFHAGMFRAADTIEVNQIDLIGLEALRVFEPTLYHALPEHRRLLLEGPGRSDRDKKEDAQVQLEALLARVSEPNRAAVKQILSVVFQPIEWLVQNYGFGSGFEEGWERELRACSERYFDRYFLLALPEGDVSQRDIEAVLAAVADREQLVQELLNLRKRNLLDAMLARLEAYKQRIDHAVAVPFVTALFDIGDGLSDALGLYDFGSSMHAQRIVYWYLRGFPTEAEREDVLRTAIQATIGMQLPLHIVSSERRREESRKTEYLISEARLPEFQALCLAKLRASAESGDLREHADLAWLLYRWREWAGEEEPRAWVATVARDPDGAMVIARAFTQDVRSYGMGDRVATVRPTMKLSDIEVFIDPTVLEVQLSRVPMSSWKGRDAIVASAFARAMQRRKRGKSDDAFDDDDD